MAFRITFVSLVVLLLVVSSQVSLSQNFWQSVSIPSVTSNVGCLAIGSNGHIFVGTLGSGIYRSTDDGATWKQLTTGGSQKHFYTLKIGNNGTIFAGSYLGSIYRSTDDGDTWTFSTIADGSSADTANSIVTSITINDSGTVYAATGRDGIFASSDEGSSWISIPIDFQYPFAMAFDSENNFLVGTYGSGLQISPSAVSPSWATFGFSIFSNYEIHYVDSLTIDSTVVDTVQNIRTTFHTTGRDSAVYSVTRFGDKATGHFLRADTLRWQIDSVRYALSVIKRITPLDTTRTDYFLNLNYRNYLRVSTIAIGPNGREYVGTDKGVCQRMTKIVPIGSGPLADTIAYWQEVSYPVGFQYVLSLVATSNGHVYAGTLGNGVFGSLDSGKTWAQVDTGIVFKNAGTALAKSPAGYLFCGTTKGGVYKSKSPVSVAQPVVTEKHTPVRSQFVLEQGYPNPFNPTATIPFVLNQPGRVTLKIYNTLGQVVATLHDGMLGAGQYSIPWNASEFPSGVYFYRMQSASDTQTGKLILMK